MGALGSEISLYKEYKTERAAKGALTKLKGKYLAKFLDGCHEYMDWHDKYYDEAKYATEAQRQAYINKDMKRNPDWKMFESLCDSVVVTFDYFYENEPMIERVNKVTGKKYLERLNTPAFLSPAYDSFYR